MGGIEDFFYSLGGWEGYFFLFCCSLVENLFPPFPGDTFVVLGAFLVGRKMLDLPPTYAATTAGSVLGFMVLYFVGYHWGRRLFKGKGGRFFSKARLRRVEGWFHRYGYLVIGFNRFLSGFRSVVSLGAGTVKMEPKRVFGLALLSCLVWNGVLMGVGIMLGEHGAVIVRHYQWAVFGLITTGLLLWWLKHFLRKRWLG